MESRELKQFHFALLFGKANDNIFKKNAKYPVWGPNSAKFGQKRVFHKNWAAFYYL